MWKKLILRDVIGAWLLLTGCLAAGMILNEMRENPLPLPYASPQARLDQSVDKLGEGSPLPIANKGNVGLEEMRKISADRSVVILDARPEVFYEVGHIPSALSLPRDDFEQRYRALAPVLQKRREQVLVVYCAGNDCHDSEMVGNALQRLGYAHVRIFRGGWGDWQSENLPVEKP